MQVFLSGEIHKDVSKGFRRAVSVLDKAMKRAFEERECSISRFSFFAIITPPEFAWASQERVKFSKKAGEAVCHLIVDFEAFKNGDDRSRAALFCDGILRAFARLPAAGAPARDCAALTAVFTDLAASKEWISPTPKTSASVAPAAIVKKAPARVRKEKPESRGAAMDRKRFWRLMASSRTRVRSVAGMPKLLTAKLAKRSRREIQDYARVFGELMAESYDWGLWGAAEIINSGATDDGFDYFRCWLIAMGEAVYTRALADPDSLADVVEPATGHYELEDMLYVAVEAWETKRAKSSTIPTPRGEAIARGRTASLGRRASFQGSTRA